MKAKPVDVFSINGIDPNGWYFMTVRDSGLDQIVIQPPHDDCHFEGKMARATITKSNGDKSEYPVFKGEILASPGVIDLCALAPISAYEALGNKVEISAQA